MNKNQGLTWELLLILGIVVLLMSPVGDWIGSIISEIATHHNMNLTFNPLDRSGTTVTPGTGVKGGSNAPVGHYTVDLAGGGQMTVNASSPQAAAENVKAQGGTPA